MASNTFSASNPTTADYLSKTADIGADYYTMPYSYDGVGTNGRLNTYQMGLLADRVANGADYKTEFLSMLGDGIGSGSVMAHDGSGKLGTEYNVDTGMTSYAGGFGAGNGSGAGGSNGGGGVNPYLGSMANSIASQVNENLFRNQLPTIRGNAMATGGFGGSRQGVVEANALNDANSGLSRSLSQMYLDAYNQDANRGLQQQSINNQYSLGLGNLNLGQTQADNSFYTANRSLDLQQAGLGSSLINQGNSDYLNAGQGTYNVGNTYQQAPWQTIGNFGGALSPFTGFGSTSSSSGGGLTGALGGALAGGQLASLFGSSSGMGSQPVSGMVSNLPSMYLR